MKNEWVVVYIHPPNPPCFDLPEAPMEDLFQTALGITAPWYIESLKFNVEQSRLDIFINFQRGARYP